MAFSIFFSFILFFVYKKKFRIVPFSNNSEPHFLCRISIPALKCELPIKLTLDMQKYHIPHIFNKKQ